jgi:hypothetical protein
MHLPLPREVLHTISISRRQDLHAAGMGWTAVPRPGGADDARAGEEPTG